MKGLFYSIVFLFFALQLTAKVKDSNNSGAAEKNDLPNILLSKKYREKIDLISRINSSALFYLLKSSETKYELDTIFTQSWIEQTQSLTNSVRYNYDFEDDGRRIIVKIYNWNEDENGWRITDNVIYSFNSAGMIIQAEFQHYVAPLYTTFIKVDYSYSADLLMYETFFEKADETDDWIKTEQIEYNYNSIPLLKAVFEKEWEDYDGIWLQQNKTEFEYNASQDLILESYFEYEFYSMIWTQKSKTEYIYNNLNKLSEKTEYVRGLVEGQFIEDKKQLITYNLYAQIESEIFYNYDYDLDNWIPDIRIDHSTSATGKLYEKLGFNWNSGSQDWERATRTDYLMIQNLYEQDILYSDLVNVHFPVYLFDNMVCEKIEEYTYLNDEWVNTENIKYQFNPALQVGVKDQAEANVQIYPNPTTDYVTVKTNSLSITSCYIRDIHGRLLENLNFADKAELSLSHLSSGIYLLELKQKRNTLYTGKIYKN